MSPCRVVHTLPPYSGHSEEVVPRPQSDPPGSPRDFCASPGRRRLSRTSILDSEIRGALGIAEVYGDSGDRLFEMRTWGHSG